ncbi:DNA protecting protein DprA [Caldithrix abyssi DSM 13497]|uniref:DNA protecting protein DprA n=1 Tax=Caldithrix abyssi DSM 13497 TaxID=880073 RepID=H1XUU7_CALAY|nr:DNA-processing protein DprA [Caldithrix abyssi]APF17550.1 DNA protecting protein DprA [Caldithrix abyssi DSM 13497]EHO41646.1 DNA protecting protein DprA [Caldithrix abyssi DSM 13497]
MNDFSLEALLGLFSIPTIGPTRLRKLISVFGSPEEVLKASYRSLTGVEGVDQKTAERIKQGPDHEFVRTQLRRIEQLQVQILTYWDKTYPERLKKIYDPPAFLFYKGNVQLLEQVSIAIVGTRTPTSYGRLATEQFARAFAENNFCIISGFARGVDSIGHEIALQYPGSTIAVLGNGIDVIYPPENSKLFHEMTQKGLILTEYPMGVKPEAGNFPKRNRIISGLAAAVLITEAGEKSGALLTAMYANDQNREVFAVPGSIFSPKSAGCNRLIKQGAIPALSAEDVLEELAPQLQWALKKSKPPDFKLDGNLKKIYDLLSDEPLHVDQIAFETQLSPAETLSALLTLELMGAIRQMAGKMFIRL